MATTVSLPALGEGITVAEIIALRVQSDDQVARGDTLVEIESGKATIELPSPVAGTVAAIHVAVGDSVRPGDPLLELDNTGDDPPPPEQPSQTAQTEPSQAPEAQEPPARRPDPAPSATALPPAAAPSVRRLARELGIDLAQVAAEADGRISAAAVRAAAQGPTAAPAAAPPEPARDQGDGQSLSRRRRQIAALMTRSWQEIPHVFQQLEVDLTATEAWRQRHNQDHAPHLSLSVLALRAMVEALGEHPRFNAAFDGDTLRLHQQADINIAIAADAPDGLIAPVVHRVQSLSLAETAEALHGLIARSRTKDLEVDDLQGATITLSNLGPIGGGFFTPLITPPQVAAVGLGQARLLPRYHDGGLFPRLIMPLTVSYDHRIADGADGLRFAQALVRALETPLEEPS